MKRALLVALLATAVSATGAAHAASGTILAGRDATGIAQDVESGWNAGQWYCYTGSPTLHVYPRSGNCIEREAVINFTVTSGSGTIAQDHTFNYDVYCSDLPPTESTQLNDAMILHTIQFDNGPVTPINSGTFVFDLAGGDTIRLDTTEGPVPAGVPAMGVWAQLAAVAGLGLGLLWLLRRGR